jgi:imidazolonepropionase-like amidohydrolase
MDLRLVVAMALAAPLFGRADPTPAPPARAAIAFRNVDVFDGTQLVRGTTVLVRDGMIRAVGPETVVPPSAEVVEGRGKTLLPGLFDAHIHLGTYQPETFLADALAFGVTTELEMGGGDASRALRKKAAAGELGGGADLRTAGTVVTVPGGHPTQMGGPPFPTLGPGDDVQAFVDARIAEGGDYLKIIYDHAFPTLTREQLEDVVAAAHRRDQLVVAHATRQRDARDVIGAGVDGLVHIFADTAPEKDFAALAAQRQVFVVPTLSVLEAVTGPPQPPWWQAAAFASRLTPSGRASLERKMPAHLGAGMKLAHALAAVSALHRAGVSILAGTDAPSPSLAHGVSLHRELELLVQAGLTPAEALAAATSGPARTFGFHDRGRIAPGLRADLLLVDGDPTADIKATRAIAGVWKLGVRSGAR